MGNVELTFLGDKYSIPSELKEFVGYLQDFDEMREDVMELLTDQINQRKYTGGAAEDFIYYRDPLTKVGEKVITKLSTNGIFDVTLNDLVFENKGYTLLHDVCKETMQCMVNILLNAMDEWQSGYESAYNSAASNVTGSGVSIWTNSLSSALIYSAMEASTLKKQSDKAAKEYSAAMSKLHNNVFGKQEKQKTDVLINKYYPGVANALNLFISTLMETFITKLNERGVFDYSKVKGFNLKRSSELLANIELVADKKAILKEAFVCCPYNPDVYQAVLDYSFSDIETFKTAEYFMQDDILLKSLNAYCLKNKENYKAMLVPVKVIAMYKEESEKSIWLSLYSDRIRSLKLKYTSLKYAIANAQNLKFWIKSNITRSAIALCDMSESKVRSVISEVVNGNSISDDEFSTFIELGLLRFEEITVSNSSAKSLKEVNTEYLNLLSEAAIKFIQDLQIRITPLKDEANKKKKEYEEALQNYNKELDTLSYALQVLESQRDQVGLFAFKKKKILDTQIQLSRGEIDSFKKQHDPNRIKDAYEQKLNEADVLIDC